MSIKKKLLLAMTFVCLFVFVACSPTQEEELGYISGYVTNGRGGPAVDGVAVEAGESLTNTNSDGYFKIAIPAEKDMDIILAKEEYGNVRVQDVMVLDDEEIQLEIPIRKDFHPDYSKEPPVVSVVNQDSEEEVQKGDILSGEVNLDLFVTSEENNVFVYYVYLGGEQRFPAENYVEPWVSEGTVTIDTTLYPDGYTYLRVLAYDDNENATLYIIPIEINNSSEITGETPERIPYLELRSITMGQNIEDYSKRQEKLYKEKNINTDPSTLELSSGKKFDLESAPKDASLFNEVYWTPVEDADGYKVYRSFDGENYELISQITANNINGTNSITDFSTRLVVDKKTYYKVVPYNKNGDGEGIVRDVTPLPAISVYLESPGNRETEVPLSPTFEWRIESSSPLPEEILTKSNLTLYEGTSYKLGDLDIENVTEYTLPIELEPNGVYSWDVAYAEAYTYYYMEDDGVSLASSVAGNKNGSRNGEFVFSTITEER